MRGALDSRRLARRHARLRLSHVDARQDRRSRTSARWSCGTRPTPTLVSIEYKSEKKIVKLEKNGASGYWWGTDTTIEMTRRRRSRRRRSGGLGAGSGSARLGGWVARRAPAGAGRGRSGSGAGSGVGSAEAGRRRDEEVAQDARVPARRAGDKLVKNSPRRARCAISASRTTREEGLQARRCEDDGHGHVQGRRTHTFLVGGSVYGGSDQATRSISSRARRTCSRRNGRRRSRSASRACSSPIRAASTPRRSTRSTIEAGGKTQDRDPRHRRRPRASRSRRGASRRHKKPNQTRRELHRQREQPAARPSTRPTSRSRT